MNDDLHPSDTPSDELLAVNALVDGTATATDQAMVEASPELRRLVAEMRSDRDRLTAVDVPQHLRESAIVAALAAFDRGAKGAELTSPTSQVGAPVVQLDQRRREYRLVMAAAAAVVVLFVGAAAFGTFGRSDDESFDATAATSLEFTEQARTSAASPSAEMDATAIGATEAADAAPAQPPEATDAASSDDAGESGSAGSIVETDGPDATIGSIDAPADALESIADESELAAYARDREPLVATDGTGSCVSDDVSVLGAVNYDGRDAVVVRDDASGEVTAIDLVTCDPLASVSP